MADTEAIGRLASLALRSGIPITAVRDQLRGISCDRAVGVGPNKVLSAPDAVAQAIERYLLEREGVQEELPIGSSATQAAGMVQAEPSSEAARARHGLHGDTAGPVVPGELPRLRHRPARLRGGVREVPRVRLQRVRIGDILAGGRRRAAGALDPLTAPAVDSGPRVRPPGLRPECSRTSDPSIHPGLEARLPWE
jgi:hypothetical protein